MWKDIVKAHFFIELIGILAVLILLLLCAFFGVL